MRGLVAVLMAGVLAVGGCADAAPGANDTQPGEATAPAARSGTGAGPESVGPPAGLTELKVAVDDSLAEAFVEVERAFEAHHPNIEVVLEYGDGLSLADRIAGGEPADVLVTDDPFAAQGVRLNAEPVEVGRVNLVLVQPGTGVSFIDFVREGDGRRILIESGLLRP
ncbi:molybdate ABC transporter substrate-binding protein [Actinoplanes xinjiangensis]|uniref:molybdate ABC transporter substrate-binding protein n=1 Tax=Actinoplanes xinjiangensis TaxID=512350 RepID=UPI0034377870